MSLIADPSVPSRSKVLPILAGAGGLLLVLGIWSCRKASSKTDAKGARAVPVTTATARTGDLDLTLSALGTVTPLDAVTVKTRIDGQLMRVAFTEGQLVKAGALLAEIDPRPYQIQLLQAEGQKAKDEAAYRNALADLKRFQRLQEQGIVTGQQLDTQASAVDQFAAAVKSDLAAVESAKLNLTYSRITAPVAGRVGLRQADPGNMVHASDPNGLVVIAPVQPISVVFTVPADSIQRVVQRQDQGKLKVQALDRDSVKPLAEGTLIAIDNQVDPATGTVKLKALFANESKALFPNQFVNVKLRVETLRQVVRIPAAAVQRSPQGTFVYVVKPDSTVDSRPVELLATDGDTAALAKGLSEGETVVTDGLDKLRPGAKVLLPEAKGERRK